MAINIRLPKSIKRITVIQPQEGSAVAAPLTVYSEKKKKRKKQTKGLRVLERLARRNIRANRAYAEAYLDRHQRSNRKKRDGWLRDLGLNMFRANRKAAKKLKLAKLMRG